MDDIQNIMAKLSITKRYSGRYYLAMGVEIILENPDKCLKITKDIYPPIAAKYGTTPTNVAHGISRVVTKAQGYDIVFLEKMAGYRLNKEENLTNMEFLSIIADYIAGQRENSGN